jgi:hypothetical protein
MSEYTAARRWTARCTVLLTVINVPKLHTLREGSAPSLLFYLSTSSLWVSSPNSIRKRKIGRSDSIRSKGMREDHTFDLLK